jgi:hypothetical protein
MRKTRELEFMVYPYQTGRVGRTEPPVTIDQAAPGQTTLSGAHVRKTERLLESHQGVDLPHGSMPSCLQKRLRQVICENSTAQTTDTNSGPSLAPGPLSFLGLCFKGLEAYCFGTMNVTAGPAHRRGPFWNRFRPIINSGFRPRRLRVGIILILGRVVEAIMTHLCRSTGARG